MWSSSGFPIAKVLLQKWECVLFCDPVLLPDLEHVRSIQLFKMNHQHLENIWIPAHAWLAMWMKTHSPKEARGKPSALCGSLTQSGALQSSRRLYKQALSLLPSFGLVEPQTPLLNRPGPPSGRLAHSPPLSVNTFSFSKTCPACSHSHPAYPYLLPTHK